MWFCFEWVGLKSGCGDPKTGDTRARKPRT